MSILAIDHLSFSYRAPHPVLKDVSLSMDCGEVFCLLGPNGSGKTTLLSQIVHPSVENRKKIRINDTPLDILPLKEKAKMIGLVPQKIVFFHISVYQTVIMGRYPYSPSFFLKPQKEDYEAADRAIELMGISKLIHRQLNTLSGGEIQRVFIAQSIAKRADVYLFDEPMSALDPEYQTDFLRMVQWLSENRKAVLFTTHNPNHCFALPNARIGIISRERQLLELPEMSEENIDIIEQVFNGSIQIKYSEAHHAFVSAFSIG